MDAVMTGVDFDRKAAAKYLDVQAQTLAAWANRGVGPEFYKIGSNVRYRRDDLEAFLQRCKVRPGATDAE